MGDTMLHGVLNMPLPDDPAEIGVVDWMQFRDRAREASARIESLEAALAEMTRRRDEWRKKAEGFDAVRLALREKVGTPWPPHMSRLLWAGIAADEKKRADDAEAALQAADELADAAQRLEHIARQNTDNAKVWEDACEAVCAALAAYRKARGDET